MAEKIAEQSAWDAAVEWPQLAPLSESTTADVVIIGGGLTGIASAYLLSQAGYKVVVLEKDELGHGATGVTTAFLTQYLDTDLHDLITIWGRERAASILAAHGAAIDLVEQVVEKEKIECEFTRCSNYACATTEADRAALQREQRAGEQLGLPVSFKETGLPFAKSGWLELTGQAKFHPLQYLAALVKIVTERGVRIFTATRAEKVIENDSGVEVTAGKYTVQAHYAVVATHAPFNKKLFFKKAFYTSYVLNATLPRGALPAAIYEDTANPYHYWRVDRGEQQDRLIFGGADHRSDIPVNPAKSWQALEDNLKHLLAGIPYEVVSRWKGPILETVDGLAYIGPFDHNNILYATGFSGNGVTYGHIAAQVMADYIQQKANPWHTLFDARRRPSLTALLYKGRDYSGELIGGALRNTFRR